MKIVFLDAATMGDASMEEIAAQGEFVCYPSSTAEEARERAADADVVLLNKVIVNEAFLDACPKVRLICEAGTGINNIDTKLLLCKLPARHDDVAHGDIRGDARLRQVVFDSLCRVVRCRLRV